MKYQTPIGSILLISANLICPSPAAEIIPITGPAGETNVHVEAMSADGSTLIALAGSTFFFWNPTTGATALTDPGFSRFFDISADGLTLLVQAADNTFGRWTQATGFTPLPFSPPESHNVFLPQAISDDGLVVAGSVTIDTVGGRPFRWSAADGYSIAPPVSGANWNRTIHLSGDGRVIGGSGYIAPATRAFRWVFGSDPTTIGTLPGGNSSSLTYASNYSGSAIVGTGGSAGGQESLRWTSDAGMHGIGDLPGGTYFGSAIATSDDGSVVMGWSNTDNPDAIGNTDVYLWTPGGGMRPMTEVFANEGVTGMDGWRFVPPADSYTTVSADGTAFWGSGFYQITSRFWYLKLDTPLDTGAGTITINDYVDGIWAEPASWPGATVPAPEDHWHHLAPGGDGLHTAKMHGEHHVLDLTWTSSDRLNIWGWPNNWRQGNLVVDGHFRLGAGSFLAQHWDPRIIFNGPVTITGGTIGSTDDTNAGGEFLFADDTDITINGGTWVFGRQHDPAHSNFRSWKTAVTWGTGTISFDQIAINHYPTFHMLGDTQITGNNKNVLTRSTTGRGGFRKTGPGKLIFQASHNGSPLTYAHQNITYIDEGEFQCDGALTNSQLELAEAATVSGSGSLWGLVGEGIIAGSLTVTDRFAPNDSSNGQFTFSGTSLTLQGQTRMDLVGAAPSLSDKVTSTSGGTLVLDGATLAADPSSATIGQVFPLFTGFAEVTGTFTDMPDGTVLAYPFWVSQGFAIRINYPGDGVVATIVSAPNTFTNAAASLPADQRGANDNADGDQFSNLLDFLFDQNLAASDTTPITTALAPDNGVTVTFPLAQDITGASLSLQTSTDASTWQTAWNSTTDPALADPAITSTATSPAGILSVSIKINPPASGEKLFLRFRAETTEAP